MPGPPPPGLAAPGRYVRANPNRPILDGAARHADSLRRATGAWGPSVVTALGATQVDAAGTTGVVGKKTLLMTGDKVVAANAALTAAGSGLRFASAGDEVAVGAARMRKVNLALPLRAGGPDDALRVRRAAGQDVTYADCHRSAVSAMGFDYDPAAALDCEKPAIPAGVFADGEVRDAPKTPALKAMIPNVIGDLSPENQKLLGRAERYTGSVAERSGRAVIGAYLPKLTAADEFPGLTQPFADMDRMSQHVTDQMLVRPNAADITANRLQEKQERHLLQRLQQEEDAAAGAGGRAAVRIDAVTPAQRQRLGQEAEYPRALSADEQVAATAESVRIQTEKASIAEAKKTWTKFNLLSLCADAMKGAAPQDEKIATAKARLREALGDKLTAGVADPDERARLAGFVDDFPIADAAAAYTDMCQTLKINEYADPQPGQALTLVSAGASDLWKEIDNQTTRDELMYRKRIFVAGKETDARQRAHAGPGAPPVPVRPEDVTEQMMARWGTDMGAPTDLETWNFHWAAVVAKQGNDYTTLENFSVEDPAAVNGDQVFNTFGADKGFYDHYKDTGFFGTAGVAMCFDKNPPA